MTNTIHATTTASRPGHAPSIRAYSCRRIRPSTRWRRPICRRRSRPRRSGSGLRAGNLGEQPADQL